MCSLQLRYFQRHLNKASGPSTNRGKTAIPRPPNAFAFIFLFLFIIVIRLLTDSMCSHAGSIPFMSIGVRILLIDWEGHIFSEKILHKIRSKTVKKFKKFTKKNREGWRTIPLISSAYAVDSIFCGQEISNPNPCLRPSPPPLIG